MCPLNSETISKIKPTFSPKKIKVNELRASMQTPQEYSNTSPTILNLQLSGLGKDCSNLDIRQLCEGFHIISPELENDTLTGQCKGKASLSLRCNDSKAYKDFQIKMLSKGIQIEKKENTQVLKSNYWQISNVPLKEFRNSRTPNPDVDARTAKVNEQLSSVFGRPRRFTPVRLERDRNFQAQLQWKKTKSTKKDML